MCYNDLVLCDVPRVAIETAITAWADFKRDPGDNDKFRALDWQINVALAKWRNYSDTRKASGA